MAENINILVTAGDTYENIDDVRRITHMATGRLGSLIADEFTRCGAKVTYLCGERSLRPALPVEQTVVITGVIQLQNAMEKLLKEQKYHAVVHSMAVSDYVAGGIATEEDLVSYIAEKINALEIPFNSSQLENCIISALRQVAGGAADGKINSDLEKLIVFLNRAPKVISIVKKIQPSTMLVGFKLLSDVNESELIEAADLQIKNSQSDFVLANDLAGIEGDKHKAMLISKNGILERPANKQEIATAIAKHVLQAAGLTGR